MTPEMHLHTQKRRVSPGLAFITQSVLRRSKRDSYCICWKMRLWQRLSTRWCDVTGVMGEFYTNKHHGGWSASIINNNGSRNIVWKTLHLSVWVQKPDEPGIIKPRRSNFRVIRPSVVDNKMEGNQRWLIWYVFIKFSATKAYLHL
jgi:hypothetical protein